MVVAVGLAIVNGVPVPTEVPPQLTVYQLKVVPEPPTAVRTMFPPVLEQKLLASLEAEVGVTGAAATVTVTLAQLELVQPAVSHRA